MALPIVPVASSRILCINSCAIRRRQSLVPKKHRLRDNHRNPDERNTYGYMARCTHSWNRSPSNSRPGRYWRYGYSRNPIRCLTGGWSSRWLHVLHHRCKRCPWRSWLPRSDLPEYPYYEPGPPGSIDSCGGRRRYSRTTRIYRSFV